MRTSVVDTCHSKVTLKPAALASLGSLLHMLHLTPHLRPIHQNLLLTKSPVDSQALSSLGGTDLDHGLDSNPDSLTSYVTQNKLLNLSIPQIPHKVRIVIVPTAYREVFIQYCTTMFRTVLDSVRAQQMSGIINDYFLA